MPIFEFECSRCGKKFEEFFHCYEDSVGAIVCCGQPANRLVSRLGRPTFPSEGITLEHLPGGPRHFSSQREMSEYAKANDLELGALL